MFNNEIRTYRQRSKTVAGIILCSLLFHGCGFIPKDGPTGAEVRSEAEVRIEDPGRLSYAMVKLTPIVLSLMQTEPQPVAHFGRLARFSSKADIRVTASDTVSVSIFESGSGGLFIPPEAGARPGNFVQIPTQEIDRNGSITIPYGGTVQALGRTPRQIESAIVAKLKERAIEPQAIVTIGERSSNAVTVLGDVKQAAIIPLRPGGLKLLGAIARAGGSTAAAHSTIVSVQRKGRTEQALLTTILEDPRQNIELAAEDVVHVTAESRIYMAFGAIGRGSASISIGLGGGASTPGTRFVIDRANISLTEAIANAGGVQSGSADPRSVFLFRYTPRTILENVGIDLSGMPSSQVPTVYTVDLSQAEGYFLANNFFIKHNDIIYIAESPSVDLQKFLGIINSINTTAQGTLGTVTAVRSVFGQ